MKRSEIVTLLIASVLLLFISTDGVFASAKDHAVLLANNHNNNNKNKNNNKNNDPAPITTDPTEKNTGSGTTTDPTEKNTGSGIDPTEKNTGSDMGATGRSGNVTAEKKKGRKHSKKKKKDKEKEKEQNPGSVSCAGVVSPGVHGIWRPGSTVRVINRMGSDWQGAIQQAVESSNRVDPRVTFVYEGNDGGVTPGPGIITINPVNLASNTSYHGLTEPHDTDRDGYLDTVTIYFNNYWYSGRYPWPKHPAREALACHELGHARGLLHALPDQIGNCMGGKDNGIVGEPIVPGPDSLADLARAYTVAPVCYPEK